MKEYKGARAIFTNHGYIVFQLSTGDNVEILFIEAERGYGKDLLKSLCEAIEPYHSIFVVRLASNEAAGKFYRKWGFKEYRVPGLYKTEDAIIGVVEYNELCRRLSIN